MAEEVYVVKRADLFPHAERLHGFVPRSGTFLRRVEHYGYFVPRDRAEKDASLKQVIPYGVLVWESGPRAEDCEVFLLQRSRAGSEARLHDRVSLGVGGHLNPPDADCLSGPDRASQLLENGLMRELSEELKVETPVTYRLVGVLNDDTNEVGSVHFGVVFTMRVETPRVEVRETESLGGRFQPLGTLESYRDRMESWSSLLLDRLSEVLRR